MKRYALGFALIYWVSGGYSKAIICQTENGRQVFHCANWIALNKDHYIDEHLDKIKYIETNQETICEVLEEEAWEF